MTAVITRDDGFWRASLPNGSEDTSRTYAKLAARYPDHRLELRLRAWPPVSLRGYPAGDLEIFCAPPGTKLLEHEARQDDGRFDMSGWAPWNSWAVLPETDKPQILVRGSKAAAWPPSPWTRVESSKLLGKNRLALVAPLPLDEAEATVAGSLDYTSPSVFIVLRPHDARYVVSLGLGKFTIRVPGSYATHEDALDIGKDAWRQHILEETDWISRMRGGRLDWGTVLRPRADPVVLCCEQGENAWNAYHRWKAEQGDDVPFIEEEDEP